MFTKVYKFFLILIEQPLKATLLRNDHEDVLKNNQISA